VNNFFVKSLDCVDDVYNCMFQYSSREDYVNYIKNVGFFVSTSNYESFGLYYLELLASGVVGVFVDKPWIRKLLPDYKYIVNKNHVVSVVGQLHSDYVAANKYIHDDVIPFIKLKYNDTVFYESLISLFKL